MSAYGSVWERHREAERDLAEQFGLSGRLDCNQARNRIAKAQELIAIVERLELEMQEETPDR